MVPPQEPVDWVIAGGIFAAFLALLVLLIVQRARARYWSHEYDQMLAERDRWRDIYRDLRDRTGGGMALADSDAVEQAESLREYAAHVRELGPDYGEPYDIAVSIAHAMEAIADELDPPEEEHDEHGAEVAHVR